MRCPALLRGSSLWSRSGRQGNSKDYVSDAVLTKPLEWHDAEARRRAKHSASRTSALFRLFLEAAGVAAQKWSMSVMNRSNTYTFGDVFGQYTATMQSMVDTSLRNDGKPTARADLARTGMAAYEAALQAGLIAALLDIDTGTTSVGYESWYPSCLDYIDRGSSGDPSAIFYEGEPYPAANLDVDGNGDIDPMDMAIVA